MKTKADKERFKDWFVDYFKARQFNGASIYVKDKAFVQRQSDIYFDMANKYIKPEQYRDFFSFLRSTEQGFCDDYKFAQKCAEYSNRNQTNNTSATHLKINDAEFERDLLEYAVIAWYLAWKAESPAVKDSYRNVGSIVAGICGGGKITMYYNSLDKKLKYSAFYKRIKSNDKYAKGLTQEQVELIEEGIIKMKDMAKDRRAKKNALEAVKTVKEGWSNDNRD